MLDTLVEEESSIFGKFFTKSQLKKMEKQNKKQNKNNVTPIQHNQGYQKRNTFQLKAKTQKQQEFINKIIQHDQVIAFGPAGTGKTYVATAYAATLFLDKKISKIVLTRPNVSLSKSIGLLPGDKNEKFSSWTAPFLEVLKEVMGSAAYEIALKRGDIEMVPFEFMRGRSFKNAFVLVDECQSTTKEEMICLVTRIGEGSKLIMFGDIRQKDFDKYSGLEFVVDSIKRNSNLEKNVGLVEFSIDDVVRSDICAMWVRHIYS